MAPTAMALHGLSPGLPVIGLTRWARWLAYVLLHRQSVRRARVVAVQASASIYRILDNKYYMDKFNENVLSRGARLLLGNGPLEGRRCGLIDGGIVNGSAQVGRLVRRRRLAHLPDRLQLYHYAFVMILGASA